MGLYSAIRAPPETGKDVRWHEGLYYASLNCNAHNVTTYRC
jgi:hypothetical protein